MQYTKEVALLEAAFQLSEKQNPDVWPGYTSLSDASLGDTSPCDASPGDAIPGDASPGGASLGDASPGDVSPGDASPVAQARKQISDTLVTAISEIVAGLEHPSSQAEREHVSFVIHSILFDSFYKHVLYLMNKCEPRKTLFTRRNNTCQNPLDVFPRIGSRLYYIILARLDWGHLFGQMVSSLPVDHSKLILKEVLCLIIEEPQEKVEDFVADIVSGMLPNGHSNTHSVVDLISTGQQSPRIDHPEKLRNWLVFFDILFDILKKEPDDSKENDDTLYKIASSCISRLLNFFNGHIKQKLIMIEETKRLQMKEQSHTRKPHTGQPHTGQPCTGQPCTSIPIKFYQKLQQLLTDESENTFRFGSVVGKSIDSSTDDDLNNFIHSFLCCLNGYIGACRQPVTDASKALQPSYDENQGKAIFWEKCYHLLKLLKPLFNEPEKIGREFPHLALLETEFHQHFHQEEVDDRLGGISEQTQIVEDDFMTAIWRVDNRLIGYQESLMWLLKNSSHYYTNELWISCLDRNVPSFRSLKLLQCLVNCTIQQQLLHGDRTQSKLVDRLLKVLLKSFEMVSIGIQNSIRDYFTEQQHELLRFYLYEEYTSVSLQQQVIVAFNKLVNSSNNNNVQELLQYVSPIAFQSPRQTIQKAVMESVNNAGVIPLVSQIFQGMTSLCSYKETKKTLTFLCMTLYDNAIRLSSLKQWTNFMNLTKTLLQAFKPPMHPSYPFLKPPVLSSHELLDVCIYPNLYHHNEHPHGDHLHGDHFHGGHLHGDRLHGDHFHGGHLHGDHPHGDHLHGDHLHDDHLHGDYLHGDHLHSDRLHGDGLHGTMHPRINLLHSLQLLKITFDAPLSGTMFTESMDRDHRFPIMLCLASFINEGIVLWDANEECVNREDVKELSKTLLQMLCKTLHNAQCTEYDIKGLQWLMFKVRSFHWSVELYLRFLLADCLSNKEVAAQFSISNFFNSEWKSTYLNRECLEQIVLAFLQCCQISPAIGEIHLQSILHHDTTKDGLLLALVRALAQLLPQCTQPEWYNITKMLKNLLGRKILHVPRSTKFINELPLLNLKDNSVELGISSLFLMLFELLGSGSCPWSHTSGVWQHTVKCYVTVMKELLSNIQECSSTDQALSRGFLIGQLFCHSLEVMGYIPESVKGQLFVLTLELVSMLEESTENPVREMFLATKQNIIFQNLVLRRIDSEDKKTLEQRLKTLDMM